MNRENRTSEEEECRMRIFGAVKISAAITRNKTENVQDFHTTGLRYESQRRGAIW